MKKLESALFMLAFAILVVSLNTTTASCGGGGGGGGAVAQSTSGAGGNLHFSTTFITIDIPAGASTIARSIVFTPGSDEVLLKVLCEGTFTRTTSSGSGSWLQMQVTPLGGYTKNSLDAPMTFGPQADSPFMLEAGGFEWDEVASYTIQVNALTDATWAGFLENVRFRILTLKVFRADPSPQITG